VEDAREVALNSLQLQAPRRRLHNIEGIARTHLSHVYSYISVGEVSMHHIKVEGSRYAIAAAHARAEI
jgi:hypothetical protein